mmetsp:Transcript_1715/g.10572  ORF Transcript_1715/g.10572 Transcript_1715/m.10572 type:complete len:463 (+) Transcript_1715:225-1613(+)
MHSLKQKDVRDDISYTVFPVRSDVQAEFHTGALAVQRALEVGGDVLICSTRSLNPELVIIQSNHTKRGLEGRKPRMEGYKGGRLGMCTRTRTGLRLGPFKSCRSVFLQVGRGLQQDLCHSWRLQSGASVSLLAVLVESFEELNTSAQTTYIQQYSEVGLCHFLEGGVFLERRDSLVQLKDFLLHNEKESCRSNVLQDLRDQCFTSASSGQVVLVKTLHLPANKKRLLIYNTCSSGIGSRCKSVISGTNMTWWCLRCFGTANNEKGPNHKSCCCNQYCTGGTGRELNNTAPHGWCKSSVFCAADSCEIPLAWLSFLLWGRFNSTPFEGDNVSCLKLARHACVVPDGCKECWKQPSRRFEECHFQGCKIKQSWSCHVSRSQEDAQASARRRYLKMNITTKQADVDKDQSNRNSDLVFYIFCGLLAFTIVLGVFILLYTWLRKRRWRGVHVTSTIHNELQMPGCE